MQRTLKFFTFLLFFLYSTIATNVDASTTFEEIKTNNTQTVALDCGNSTCRGDQYYVSRGLNLPIGTSFNRIRVFTTATQGQAPRLYIYTPTDLGASRTSCTDGTCVADDSYGSIISYSVASTNGDGSWVYTIPTQSIGSTGKYLYLSLDPNAPFQHFDMYQAVSGQIEDGHNMTTLSEPGYAYQLCTNTCDAVGTWTGGSNTPQPLPSETFLTRFLSGSVSGNRNSSVVNYSYFLQTSEFTPSNRPDYVNLTVLNANTGASVYSYQQFILPLTQGTSTKSFPSGDLKSDGNYVAYLSFWNVNTTSLTFSRSTYTITWTQNGNTISNLNTTQTTGLVTDKTINYEKCDILDVGCGIRNAFKYLFVPSQQNLTIIKSTYDSLYTRAPFIYVTQIPQVISTVFSGNTSTFTIGVNTGIGNVTFFDTNTFNNVPYRTTLRDLQAYVLWFGFAFLIYRKTLAIHNKD